MSTGIPFSIRFSGITVRITPPDLPFRLPDEFSSLLWESADTPDGDYEIILLEEPLLEPEVPYYQYCGITVYRTDECWLRINSLRRSDNGCQVACLLRPEGKHTLYYPAALWEHYATPLHCAHLMGLETVLLKKNAFLLHSSVVMLERKAVLFFGPSGAGKSTQASLWQTHLGAQVLNGDRCVVMEKEGIFYGGGSPLAGSSNIYRREQAPIAAIFMLEKSPENHVTRLGFSALAPMLGQTLINSWDTEFMEKLTGLYQNLLAKVPVYRLRCRADEDAVRMAYRWAFEQKGGA